MSYTYEEAYDLMMTLFKTAWDGTGHRAFYENIENDRETDDTAFAHVSISHASGFQATLGGTGSRIFRRTGVITIMIYTQAGKGLQESHQLAKVAADAFEGQSTGGIWFRNVRINEIGREGAFYQTNVIVEFEYDETK